MTIEQLGSRGEFVGPLGIVLTLAYLAFQVKPATAAFVEHVERQLVERERESK